MIDTGKDHDMAPVDETTLAIYSDSLQRCLDRPRFLERFYELFLESSEEVRQKFVHTSFPDQRRALKKSLLEASWIASPGVEAKAELERVAHTHSRAEKDIPPHLYDLWLENLIRTVQEMDPRFSPEIEGAWRAVLARVIGFMKSKY